MCLFCASDLLRLSSQVNKANPIRMKGNYFFKSELSEENSIGSFSSSLPAVTKD